MKERKVGERFLTKKGVVLEIVSTDPNEGCDLCYYASKSKCAKALCIANTRKDLKDIYFKNVTDSLTEAQKIQLERGLLADCDVQQQAE